jgi:hypothetical protein
LSKAASERHYRRDEVTKLDKAQAKFGPDGQITAEGALDLRGEHINIEKVVTCVYCLGDAKLQRFLMSTKKGLSISRVQCPFCGHGMFMNSVIRNWTAEGYADFVYSSARFGFFQEVKKSIGFDVWNERLMAHGWNVAFWARYKELKAQNPGLSRLEQLGY